MLKMRVERVMLRLVLVFITSISSYIQMAEFYCFYLMLPLCIKPCFHRLLEEKRKQQEIDQKRKEEDHDMLARLNQFGNGTPGSAQFPGPQGSAGTPGNADNGFQFPKYSPVSSFFQFKSEV